jgi:transcriptional antiterminator RfaH
MTNRRWYVAKTKSGQDHIAVENLARQGFVTYMPKIIVERVRKSKIVRDSESLFPGYVFISFDLSDNVWRVINSTRGVLRLLSLNENGKPSIVADDEIRCLQEQEKTGFFNVSQVMHFRKGDLIKIKNGPYLDKAGKVLRTRGERVEFLMKLLGRQVRCIAAAHTLYVVTSAPVR